MQHPHPCGTIMYNSKQTCLGQEHALQAKPRVPRRRRFSPVLTLLSRGSLRCFTLRTGNGQEGQAQSNSRRVLVSPKHVGSLAKHQTVYTPGVLARARARPSQNLHSADGGHAGGAPTRPCAHPTAKSFSRVQLAPQGLDMLFEYCTYPELIPQPGRAHRNGGAWSSRGDMALSKGPLRGRSCAEPVRCAT